MPPVISHGLQHMELSVQRSLCQHKPQWSRCELIQSKNTHALLGREGTALSLSLL